MQEEAMSTTSTTTHRSTQILRDTISGDVFVPGDNGYDQARGAWNLAADQRPAVVVFAQSAADVIQAVQVARSQGMRIAPQGTGHGALPLEALDGAMLLKTSRMRRVDINAAARIARAEAGAQWQDVTVPAAEHGLAALAGSSPNVGVTGYTLGGGLGWLGRRYGLAANSVTAVEIVTPDGRLGRADADYEPDLFWAVRGGGGSVGVVTALEMTLYPVSELYGGVLFFPIERSAEVLQAWREWTDTVPDELTSIGRILRVPPLPELPEFVRGRPFVLVEAAYLGDAAGGAELLRPLRQLRPEIDTFAMIPAPELQKLNMDPDQPLPVEGDGMLLADAAAGAINKLVELAGPDADTPLLSVELRHLGGALAREVPGHGAQPNMDAAYLMYAAGFAPTPEAGDTVRAHARAVKDALNAWRADYDYYNFLESPAEADAALPRASARRLREFKAMYDPDQTIVSAHPVRPASD
jgi:FAD/FMN-containing dehydrogenase